MGSENLKIRPYARLLTMLGDQLIKDERIALMELIKNGYDADASFVKVTFQNFGEKYEVFPDSKILIQDDGNGMTKDVLVKHFLNPATPIKKQKKDRDERTKKGRVIQGEKGIGRFAMLKIGKKINIITRPLDGEEEYILHYDFSKYNDDFLNSKENNADDALFLDDLTVVLETRRPEVFDGHETCLGINRINIAPNGTIIEISNLIEGWTERKIENIATDVTKLQSIFDVLVTSDKNDNRKSDSFTVYLYKDKNVLNYTSDYINKLSVLLENKAVLKIKDGFFNADDLSFSYKENDIPKKVFLTDSALQGVFIAKKYFWGNETTSLTNRKIECGSFYFAFYIFDFSNKAPEKFVLDSDDKKIIKAHRVYLYRDGIRVYPYGDPDDDWLQIDMLRGTVSAGDFFSNDQVVGVVEISQENNPKLRDKTNREGLIEKGFVTSDFIKLIQTFLAYLRAKSYGKYQINNENRINQKKITTRQVENDFEELKDFVKNDRRAFDKVVKLKKSFDVERNVLVRRAEKTEDLAGVGLSVEVASHDILAMMSKVFSNLDGLLADLMMDKEIAKDILLNDLVAVKGGLQFVYEQLKDIQLLFTSAKHRRKCIVVKEIVEKVYKIYLRIAKKQNISVEIMELSKSPLIAKTTDAVLLQVLLNLFDNSIYWLDTVDINDKKILVTLDGQNGCLIFSDNGPGVQRDDLPYIFEPFYSGKGEDGRGLGLYIARQLLERNDYSIFYADIKNERKLPGANFVVSFVTEME